MLYKCIPTLRPSKFNLSLRSVRWKEYIPLEMTLDTAHGTHVLKRRS